MFLQRNTNIETNIRTLSWSGMVIDVLRVCVCIYKEIKEKNETKGYENWI